MRDARNCVNPAVEKKRIGGDENCRPAANPGGAIAMIDRLQADQLLHRLMAKSDASEAEAKLALRAARVFWEDGPQSVAPGAWDWRRVVLTCLEKHELREVGTSGRSSIGYPRQH